MLLRLLKKLVVPGVVLFVLLLISNSTEGFQSVFGETVGMATYYITGIGIWLTIGWMLSEFVNIIVWDEYFRKKKGVEPPDVIETLTFLAIFVLALMGIVGVVFEQSVTGIWAMTTVAGGVVGFALKDMIADFFTGIALNLDRTFKVGDWITITDETGKKVNGWIEEITWRTTRIGQQDGSILIYPNNVISNTAFRNLTMDGPERRFEIEFTIDPNIDSKKVIRVLTAAVRSVPGIMEKPKPVAVIDKATTDGIIYEIRYWVNPTDFSPRKAKNHTIYAALHHLKQANIPLSLSSDQYIASMPERYVDIDVHREKIIEKVASLKLLNQVEKDQLAKSMIQHAIKEGKSIIKQGDDGDSLFILTEGVMDVYIFNQEQNKELKVGQVYPGEFFGERSLLTGDPRSASVVAGSDCVAYEITRDHLEPIFKTRPVLLEKISKLIAEREVNNSKVFADYSAGQKLQEQHKAEMSFMDKMKDFFGISSTEPAPPEEITKPIGGKDERNPFSYH